MKNIKTYEEFDWHNLLHHTIDIGMISLPFITGYLGNKLRTRMFKKKLNKSQSVELMSPDRWSSRKWKIEENDNQIILTSKSKEEIDLKDNIILKIDKKKMTINFIQKRIIEDEDAFNWVDKLKKSEFDQIIDGISFVKKVTGMIKECTYELTDSGYNVDVDSVDFVKKSFDIKVFVEDGQRFNISDIGEKLEDALYRITSEFDVNVVKPFRLIYDSNYVTEYKDGKIILSNSDEYPGKRGFHDIRQLIISFAK